MQRRSIPLTLLLLFLAIICVGCTTDTTLPENYYKVNLDFPGMKLENYTEDASSLTQAVDAMVYTELPKVLKTYLNENGNEITQIKVTGAKGETYRDEDTVATIDMTIISNGGEVKSGEYVVAAYFTYDKTEGNNRIYFVNFAFVEDETAFQKDNGAAIFDKAAEEIA